MRGYENSGMNLGLDYDLWGEACQLRQMLQGNQSPERPTKYTLTITIIDYLPKVKDSLPYYAFFHRCDIIAQMLHMYVSQI